MPHASTNETLLLSIEERINAEPFYKSILYKMLSYCQESRTFESIKREVLSYPEMKTPLQSVQILLTWLLQCHAIEERHNNENGVMYTLSPEGAMVLKKELQADKLEALFCEDAVYKPVYIDVLTFCKKAKSRMEIESHLAQHPLLENPKLYASYFIDMLEKAGGLVWDNCWKTTQSAYAKLS